MSNQYSSKYKFSPRPEAHAMEWDKLLSPVRQAVRNLLLRIDGGVTTEREDKGLVATRCFLVYGDRGTGKTTVLHSAAYACKSPDAFFKHTEGDTRLHDEAQVSAQNLSRAVWLDVLDLEPLPPKTNLLTTVLTRVRNALDSTDKKEVTSILEEGATSARHQLTALINDATLMWEDISEPDTRSRANRQVAAAEIYAGFHGRVKKAIESLSQELAHQHGGDDPRPIILRIDNIDRSTEHLYSIVKLGEMLSCAHLWLVMAGDRQDVETFLERAYWKELIRIGESGAGATGKTDVTGEDEALVMARRQAAAASHRLLPPSHRVRVKVVEPNETLEFKPTGLQAGGEQNKSIRELLRDVKLFRNEPAGEPSDQRAKAKSGRQPSESGPPGEAKDGEREMSLLSLFDAGTLVGEEGETRLTEAAELGLRLPARSVLDLWQLAYWVTHDDLMVRVKQHEAEVIARTMLENLISESTMSSKMGRHLKEQIGRSNPQGGAILDFEAPDGSSPLTVRRLFSTDLQIRPPETKRTETGRYVLYVGRATSSQLALASPRDLAPQIKRSGTVTVRDADTWLLQGRKRPEHYRQHLAAEVRQDLVAEVELVDAEDPARDSTSGPAEDRLPDLIAAWLMVLYDVVLLGAKESFLIIPRTYSVPAAVAVDCLILEKGTSRWPLPRWKSFVAYEIHGELWRRFLLRLHGQETSPEGETSFLRRISQQGSAPRLLAAGWTGCVLRAFLALQPRKEYWGKTIGADLDRAMGQIALGKHQNAAEITKAITTMVEQVLKAAAETYKELLKVYTVTQFDDETAAVLDWLERELGNLILNAKYVPVSKQDAATQAKRVEAILRSSALWPFVRAAAFAD